MQSYDNPNGDVNICWSPSYTVPHPFARKNTILLVDRKITWVSCPVCLNEYRRRTTADIEAIREENLQAFIDERQYANCIKQGKGTV